MTELELMQAIKTKWGALFVQVTQDSGLAEAPAFLAALTANESGGDPDASRYEPGVFSALAEVLLDVRQNYGAITAAALSSAITVPGDLGAEVTVIHGLANLRQLATSWGLVQIMGYHALAFNTPNGVEDLKNPVTALPLACRMFADFRARFNLNLPDDYDALFRCWNTGRPKGVTADPKYVPNGLNRMQLYLQMG